LSADDTLPEISTDDRECLLKAVDPSVETLVDGHVHRAEPAPPPRHRSTCDGVFMA